MYFGLKNVRETYERLVNKVFKNQIRQNIKVNVDDMVIISLDESTLLQDRDTEETLVILQNIQMKLKPAKCTFRIKGKFMGYFITENEIQRSPTKIKDWKETSCPTGLKYM